MMTRTKNWIVLRWLRRLPAARYPKRRIARHSLVQQIGQDAVQAIMSAAFGGATGAPGSPDEVVTTDAEHFGLAGPLIASNASLRIARVRDVAA